MRKNFLNNFYKVFMKKVSVKLRVKTCLFSKSINRIEFLICNKLYVEMDI